MTTVLEIREKLKRLYANYNTYFNIVLKLVLALFCLIWTRSAFGGSSIFDNTYVILVAALLCSVFPVRMMPVITGIFIVGHGFGIGLDVGAVFLVVFLIIIIFYLRFTPEDGLPMILTPIAISLGLPALAPVCVGLKRKPTSAVAVVFGAYIYYLIAQVSDNRAALEELALSEFIDRMSLIFMNITTNNHMVVEMVAMAAVVVVVYAICRLGFDYAFGSAIVVGTVLYDVILFFGNSMSGNSVSLFALLISTVIVILLAGILEFFMLAVDYKGTERMEFEDDEYYYYVRAVPKMYAYKRRIQKEMEEAPVEGEAPAEEVPDIVHPDVNSVDFERKLEDSLKNL